MWEGHIQLDVRGATVIRLALSDMDNTLVPFGKPYVSTRTLKAIHAVQDAGIEFGPVTGRDYFELFRFFQGDIQGFQTGVMSSGKKVYVDGLCVYERDIDYEAFVRLNDCVKEFDGLFCVGFPADTSIENPVWIVDDNHDEVAPFERKFGFKANFVEKLPQIPYIAATIGMPMGKPGYKVVQEQVAPHFKEFYFVSAAPNWFDVVPRGVNKASGLRILMGELAVSSNEVVIFGDSANDVPGFRLVGNTVAVANATDQIKELARCHIGTSTDDGVAIALEDIACNAKQGQLPDFMRNSQ